MNPIQSFLITWTVYWLTIAAFAIVSLAAWFQHIVTCIKHESIGLLVMGAIIAPFGVLHGWGIWLGLFQR